MQRTRGSIDYISSRDNAKGTTTLASEELSNGFVFRVVERIAALRNVE